MDFSVISEEEALVVPTENDTPSSAVSWAAVLAGAAVMAALSLILLALGAGLGLSSVSPWSGVGVSTPVIGSMTIAWVILMQILASSLGGYLAGRLRTTWVRIHDDEVYFRDTAHGFLAWSVAAILTAAFLASAAASMAGHAAASQSVAASTESTSDDRPLLGYYVDMMFRADHPIVDTNDGAVRAEAGRLFTNTLRTDTTTAGDESYLAQLVAAKTGLSSTDAQARVSSVILQARQAIDSARKTSARILLWTFIALLSGAFCASYAATIGGRQRDDVVVVP